MDRVEVKPGYEALAAVLDDALEQAQSGKGKEWHASGEAFEDQLICSLGRQVGLGLLLGQAIKKAVESQRLPGKRGIAELHGAINYLAAAALLREQGIGDPGESAVEEAGECAGCQAAYKPHWADTWEDRERKAGGPPCDDCAVGEAGPERVKFSGTLIGDEPSVAVSVRGLAPEQEQRFYHFIREAVKVFQR